MRMIPILGSDEGYDVGGPASIDRPLRSTHRCARVGIRGPQLPSPAHERAGRVVEERIRLRGSDGEPLGHERSLPPAPLDQLLGLEGAVRLGDGVRRQPEILGERSDGRQPTSGRDRPSKDPFGDRGGELIRERLG
jgi:hypothetical protein